MDSEDVKNINEGENSDNISSEVIDNSKDQQIGNAANSDLKNLENGSPDDFQETEETTVVIDNKNLDETPHTKNNSTVAQKIFNDDKGTANPEINVISIIENRDIDEESFTTILTSTVKIVDEDNKVAPDGVKIESEKALVSDIETAHNASVISEETTKDGKDQNVDASDTEDQDSQSEDSDNPSEDDKPEADSKEIKDVSTETNINCKQETAVPTEKVANEKVSNTNKEMNNLIENIISDIDINIKTQEKITQLKEQELHLIQKQKELANQIHQQQILAEKLINQNQLKEQELEQTRARQLEFQQKCQRNNENVFPKVTQEYGYCLQRTGSSNLEEPANVSRSVDLQKIFTPATDAPQILPKNRKLYASSAFYSPTLHPTVEDQVELARRISHSLSDISNQTSKGQSMYVNRKKRSVKWVHEGCGQGAETDTNDNHRISKENSEANLKSELTKLDKSPLKLVMNPWGKIQDYNSLKESINVESGLLSPDSCAELITALQLHKGRGAELFAKRRRKADNWVVDETNAGIHCPSGIPDYHQYQQIKPPGSPSILPAYSDAGKHRVQLNMNHDRLIEKYSKPGVQVVKSPWEAALQTGSASSAFVEESKYQTQPPIMLAAPPLQFNSDVTDYKEPFPAPDSATSFAIASRNERNSSYNKSFDQHQPFNPQRELAYKPNVAQGWGGRNVELPIEYYGQNSYQNVENYENSFNNCSYNTKEYIQVNHDQNAAELKHRISHFINAPIHCCCCNDIKQLCLFCNRNSGVNYHNEQLEKYEQNYIQHHGPKLDQRHIFSCNRKDKLMNINRLCLQLIDPNLPNMVNGCEDKSIKEITNQINEIEANNESINVRELILSFEQQSIREQEGFQRNKQINLIDNKQRLNEGHSKLPDFGELEQTNTTEGLYVPKQISLASYVAPSMHARDQKITNNHFPVCQHDITKQPTSTLYSSIPPKQHPYDSANYQKVPSGSSMSQVNFSPSPLSFEKLAKFQESDQKNSDITKEKYLPVNQQPTYSVSNASPIPFGSGGIENRFIFSPTSKRSNYSPSGQNFNSSARGWGTNSNIKRSAVYPKAGATVAVLADNLPYSDF